MQQHRCTLPLVFASLSLCAACDVDEGGIGAAQDRKTMTPEGVNGATAGIDGEALPGVEVTIDVSPDKPTLLSLKDATVLSIDGAKETSAEWDLAFQGWDIFTNSGPSGPGLGQSFGPFDELNFLFGDEPSVPFLKSDRTGGAFEGWYAYSEGRLYSRFDVYGLRRGSQLWKVQLLGYYGDFMGTEISALYQLRYASVTENGADETVTVSVDGTAGGPLGGAEAASGCLDLDSGTVHMLSPNDARGRDDWHLCFRRDVVGVNGMAGGPGGVAATRVLASELELDELKRTSADDMLSVFADVDHATLTDPRLQYNGDRVLSSFSELWHAGESPAEGAWLVLAANGEDGYLLLFTGVDGATKSAPGKLTLRIRPVEKAQ